MHALLLSTHIVAGAAGILLGPVVIAGDLRRMATGRAAGGRVADVYGVVVLVVCLSAVGLVFVRRADLWWLVPVSALTVSLLVLGRESARRRFRGWTHGYVHGLGGSYLAQVTALVVVALVVDGPVDGTAALVPWLAPTAAGTVLVEVWRRRVVRVAAAAVPPAGRQEVAHP